MPLGLEKYKKKRDFKKTPEPAGRPIKKSGKVLSAADVSRDGVKRFVVQKHAARNLHYDFRLEVAGVLVSWAVPKEPSLDPSVKRLAIKVENHPLDYINFKGVIPKGEYGAGTVEIWDKGIYKNLLDAPMEDALKKGHLAFALAGKKLKGAFALTRFRRERGGEQWLLVKMKK